MNVLKNEISRSDKEKELIEQSPTKLVSSGHEKEVVRATFLKFMDSLMQG